jgi:dipeptidase D
LKEAIQGLEPELLWEHFYQLTQIPRCSKEEEKVRGYIVEVAKRNNFSCTTDTSGNVIVKKPATSGKETIPTVVLQGHLDMVCEKNKGTVHDFSKDPIKMKREGDWITAEGTTLGADNGIGVAAALAVLESKSIQHGPLECLFTIDEETGLTGATELQPGTLKGKILLNLDSEEDGALYIGCAGGKDTELFLKTKTEPIPPDYQAAEIKVTGLSGGHSGLNIHEGRGNAIKLLTRFLWNVLPKIKGRLTTFDGGSKHNAIPREADTIVALPQKNMEKLKKWVKKYDLIFKNELKLVDGGVSIEINESGFSAPKKMFTSRLQNKILNLLYVLPHGVIAMSSAIEGLVETSTNLAVVNQKDDKINILTSQRSSVSTGLDNVVEIVHACGRQASTKIHSGTGYPAWQPNPDSALLKKSKSILKSLFGKEPEVKAIHAGLECGIIGDKFPGMDMISFGPTIVGAHSPDEKVQISTVEKFWKFIKVLLEQI